jgi:adenine-specific DNA-methyltransferase
MDKRRVLFEQLGRERLGELTAKYGLDVRDRRAVAAHVDALVAAPLDLEAVLVSLKREELQVICDALGMDRGGREKDILVARIQEGLAGGSTSPKKFSLTPTEPKEKKSRGPRTAASSPSGDDGEVADYRHDATRKNNPPAGLIEFDRPPPQPTKTYAYDPHLDPSLQWAGKAERTSFEVDTVSLHIHERVSTQAILRAVKREEAQRSLFELIELPEGKAIDFYQHDVGWANRLILGDSLVVMNSLLEREHMAGKVQMVYLDPPYGVKFNSNFQPSISRRDVKDGDDGSLTREPEQIQAYRDTWTLGIHSYLTYMRDRLLLAREMLTETGSIFVQISDDNMHHVRELMDEVFGSANIAGTIAFSKTSGASSNRLPAVADYLLWYARDIKQVKYRQLYSEKVAGGQGATEYQWLLLPNGERRRVRPDERIEDVVGTSGGQLFALDNITSQGFRTNTSVPFSFEGKKYDPGTTSNWKTTIEGMRRLGECGRIFPRENSLRYIRFIEDFPVVPITNLWDDTGIAGRPGDKLYVVQTNPKVVARCLLMTTDPGDLVLDPTCGSGTTAFVAEQWGRRWITGDTSRVAMALARQRLLTARFPFYRLRSDRVRDGFRYRTVPHITLKSIAQNALLDQCKTRGERDRLIAASAEQEVLHDQPDQDSGRIRVAGPFTVEAIPVASLEEGDGGEAPTVPTPSESAGDHLSMMMDLLRKSGVQFPGGRHLALPTVRPVRGPYEYLHAEADVGTNGSTKRVAISFGTRHAPVTPVQVRNGIQETRGYDIVIFIGFACDPEARRMIDAGVHGRELQYANAAPDILVGDLLKTPKTTRLFTVYGAPDVVVHADKDGLVSVELVGVDLYDPNTGETRHSKGEDVAAWFVDHDYDSRTFCICQALFPGGRNPWEKLAKALKGTIDEDKFETLRTTRSLPFKPGKKIAVKVIDDRGNEVIKLVDPRVRGRAGRGAQ